MASKDRGVRIFLRVRPTKKPSGYFKFSDEDGCKVDFNVPLEQIHGHVNNTRQNFKFKFNGLLDMKATQEEVFDTVAKPSIQNALNGFNSTIFAYGQTGSGKTFTITGGAERYVDRGIIPRAMSFMFSEIQKNSERKTQIHVSYMELYNETGYDLLDDSQESKMLEDLPKVNFMEDDDGNVHLRGLSMHLCNTEEEALNLLFLGDTNRAISETPMNLASSRSHCIFTVSVESREAGSDVIRRSKLHLVDLAGSERAHKTGAAGQILREAKFINTSLHYLEMVIVALHERKTKGRSHVPYRNSKMTSLLRDSLGGNCHTAMIATISAEKEQTEESISTCRFAQRVALVENEAVVNEEVDPSSVIQRLKAEVKALKEEVMYLKQQLGTADEDEGEEVSGHEVERLRDLVKIFFDSRESDPNAPLGFGGNPSFPRIQMALKILREMVAESGSRGDGGKQSGDIGELEAEIMELKELLAHRDNEISILVNMVKQGKTIPADDAHGGSAGYAQGGGSGTVEEGSRGPSMRASKEHAAAARKPAVDAEILGDKKRAFALFRESYHANAAVEENKAILKKRYVAAKAMGQKVNAARTTINQITGQLKQLRAEEAEESSKSDPESLRQMEQELREKMDRCKMDYKKSFEHLRELKAEIERIQKQLEKQRIRMQGDFEKWHSVMIRDLENQPQESPGQRPPHRTKEAWRGDSAKQEHREGKVASDGGNVPQEAEELMTGNKDADEDIMAFFKAKEEMMKRVRGGH